VSELSIELNLLGANESIVIRNDGKSISIKRKLHLSPGTREVTTYISHAVMEQARFDVLASVLRQQRNDIRSDELQQKLAANALIKP